MTYFMARSNLVTYAFLWEKVKTVDFSETIAACDLKFGRCRQPIEIMKVCVYQVSVYRTNGPLIFTFLGTVPIPVQLGKIALFFLQLGKIAPLNLYENTGWKCHGPIPRAIKIIISNLNWQ